MWLPISFLRLKLYRRHTNKKDRCKFMAGQILAPLKQHPILDDESAYDATEIINRNVLFGTLNCTEVGSV